MFKNRKHEFLMDDAINSGLELLKDATPGSDEFTSIMHGLDALYALKEKDSKRRVSPDTMALIVGNLVGIAVIVGHERAHVVTTKAIGFVLRLR